jgi:ribose transport system ATP-binding protein
MKILAGITPADRGVVRKDGAPIRLHSPHDALAHGVTMITQELSIVPRRSVLENVLMGRLHQRLGWVRGGANLAEFRRLTEQVGFTHLDPSTVAGDLPIARQQQVEILRALARRAEVIVMDEPTAILSAHETEQLLSLMKDLAASGMLVIFISHYLEQVLSVCDTVSVLRDGHLTMSGPADEQSPRSLVAAMVGRQVDVLYPEPAPVPEEATVALEVNDLRRGDAVRGVSLQVRHGEIVALAGLIGSGRSETVRLIFGAERPDGGEVRVDGEVVPLRSPASAMGSGIAMVPEGRKEQGLILGRGVRENISLASLRSLSTGGWVRRGKERRETSDLAERVDVRGVDPRGPVWMLSGGNQQKVLFAKWLLRRPSVLIVDEPTRGVDVAAKVQIHHLLRDLAASGHAILLVSSEIEEAMGMAHRVCVMRQGRIVASFGRDELDRETLLGAAFNGLVEESRGSLS